MTTDLLQLYAPPVLEQTKRDQLIRALSSIPSKVPGVPLLTSDQITNLLNIKTNDGAPIITADAKDLIYFTISQIALLGFNEVYSDLIERQAKLITPQDIVFQSPMMMSSRVAFRRIVEDYRHKIEVSEGAFTCGKCKSNNTLSVYGQTRSADEPLTFKVTCLSCGNKWVEN